MAKQTMTGVISTVNSRAFPDNRTGDMVTLYSFQIEGSNRWLRTGKVPLPFGKGDAVEFVVDGQNVDVSTMRQAAPPTWPAPAASTAPRRERVQASGGWATSKDEYWANKEARDLEKEQRFQTVNEPRMAMSVAVEAASRVVVAALQTEALSFGTTAKSKRIGMLGDFVEELALRLAMYIEDAPNTMKAHRNTGTAARTGADERNGDYDDNE